jgi:hypothetical protein
MNRSAYQQYLQSPLWRSTRERRLHVAGNRCEFEGCGRTFGLEVHHVSYERLGRELDSDMEVVCRFHHLARHTLNIGCVICGEAVIEDDEEACDVVRQAVAEVDGNIDKVNLEQIEALLTWSNSRDGEHLVCSYHLHVLTKDD